MITADTLRTPAYDDFEIGTLELHAMIRDGQGDGRAADELRHWLEGPWMSMTPEQREFGNGLSGDLYMLNPDDGEVFEPATDEERSPQRLGLAILAARDRRDWATVLDLLRRGPLGFPPDYLAFLRARAYGELGRTAIAVAFSRHAQRLNPTETAHRLIEMDLLDQGGHTADAAAIARAWMADSALPADSRILAAGRLFAETRGTDQQAVRPVLEQVADASRAALAAIPAGPDAEEFSTYAHLLLGGCLDRLGESEAARAEFDRVLEMPPRDWDGFVAHAALRAYVGQRFGTGTTESHPSSDVLFGIVSELTPRTAA